jgi:hypothetical protein
MSDVHRRGSPNQAYGTPFVPRRRRGRSVWWVCRWGFALRDAMSDGASDLRPGEVSVSALVCTDIRTPLHTPPECLPEWLSRRFPREGGRDPSAVRVHVLERNEDYEPKEARTNSPSCGPCPKYAICSWSESTLNSMSAVARELVSRSDQSFNVPHADGNCLPFE